MPTTQGGDLHGQSKLASNEPGPHPPPQQYCYTTVLWFGYVLPYFFVKKVQQIYRQLELICRHIGRGKDGCMGVMCAA
jgi:hypothetical protein